MNRETTYEELEKRVRELEKEVARRIQEEEELLDVANKYKALFEEAPVGYTEFDSKGRITRVSRRKLEMTGYTAEEVVGKPIWNFVADKEKGKGDEHQRICYETDCHTTDRQYNSRGVGQKMISLR